MLGHSGVGKTTYMASMYGVLQTPINGFSLRTQDNTHHNDLLKEFNKIRSGVYPAATAQRGQYDFSLYFKGNAIFPFQWVDYRGGALTERQNTSEQAQQLVKELQEADGIMLFCDVDPTPRIRSKIRSQIARMVTLVTQALQSNDSPKTIAVVFTKSDLVDELDDELVEYVSSLLTAIHESRVHVGTMLPISCGVNLVNTESPVLFALHFGILFQEVHLSLEIDEYKKIEQHFIDKGGTLGGIFGDVVNKLFGGDTTYDHAYRARMLVQERKSELDKLSGPARLLGEYLEDLPMVYGEVLRKMLASD